MRQPIHAINGGHREMTPERIVGIGFVALLHVVAVWAIVNGLMQKYAKPAPTPPIVARLIDTKQPPPPPQPRMPTVDLPDKSLPSVPEPVVVIEQETPHTPPFVPTYEPPATPQPLPVPDTAASGVMSTHTTPPYPLLERRLGNQGTVKLRLSISPQGIVTAADVVQSSGFSGLDEAAVSWVLQHWKYKPAVQAGVPVASTTVAAVVFNIRTGG